MSRPIETIRNIGIVAHIDAGKTTTTERILFYTGESHRMGNVDEGTTVTDFDPEEAKRGITIYSAAISCRWKDVSINIIDTPGHVDFTAEVERSLRVLDGAVVIFSAVEGVEAQSETVWRQADHYSIPRLCFINKMDRIGASFDRTFADISKRLQGHPVAIQIPIGAEHDFSGIIDLIEMRAVYFDSESEGAVIDVTAIPDAYAETAGKWRRELLEAVACVDDSAMEIYVENDDLPADVIRRTLRKATLTGAIQPTLCGSSLDYVGVQPLLDAIAEHLPSPLDRPAIQGHTVATRKKESKPVERHPDASEPLAALVFKVQADKHGDLFFVRIYSGVLTSNARVLNARSGKKELINQLWRIQADSRTKIEEAEAGDIVAIVGLKESVTGDTLCPPQHPILLESIHFPETVISMAVEPDSSEDRKKLADALERLGRQDPTFTARVSDETGQTIISGMGELHLEVLRERLKRDFNLAVRVHKPRVSYRETIRKLVEHTGTVERTIGGANQYAQLTIRVRPADDVSSVEVDSDLKPGTLPDELEQAALTALLDEARAGGKLGFPLMKMRIDLLDADYRETETTELAISAAATRVLQEALDRADSVLLEPLMRLEVVTPDAFLGNIQADLNSRRAMIVNSEKRGDLTVLEAHVPLAQMFGYSTQVRSLSQGRASYSMEPLRYDEAPQSVLESFLG